MLNILIICIITTTKIYFRRKANIIYIVSNQHIIVVFSSAKTLQISYIGMQTQEVVIKPTLKVVLKSDSQNLDEVVVTAMGIKRSEKSLGYAVSSVKGDEITKARESNVLNSLSGKIAGLQIAQSSGTVGGSSSIQIRSASSIGYVSYPLFIIPLYVLFPVSIVSFTYVVTTFFELSTPVIIIPLVSFPNCITLSLVVCAT